MASDALTATCDCIVDYNDKLGISSYGKQILIALQQDPFPEFYKSVILASPSEPLLFVETGNNHITAKLTQFKEKCLAIILKMVLYDDYYAKPLEEQHTTLIHLLQNLIPDVIEATLKLTRNQHLQKLMEHECLQTLSTAVLKIISASCRKAELYKFYSQNRATICVDIGFSLMRTFKAEILEMEDNPREFVQLCLDTCDRQKIPHVKPQSASVIEKLCDKIDGYVDTVGQLCLEMIDYAFTGKGDPSKYEILGKYYDDCLFLQTASQTDFIDTSIIVLTFLSYMVPKRPKIADKFVLTLNKYTKDIIAMDHPVIRVRLSCFLGYYLDILYKDSKEQFI